MTAKTFTREDVMRALGMRARGDVTEYLTPAIGVFAAGILAGAVVGLLFAPKAGHELRSDIRDRISEAKSGRGRIIPESMSREARH